MTVEYPLDPGPRTPAGFGRASHRPLWAGGLGSGSILIEQISTSQLLDTTMHWGAMLGAGWFTAEIALLALASLRAWAQRFPGFVQVNNFNTTIHHYRLDGDSGRDDEDRGSRLRR